MNLFKKIKRFPLHPILTSLMVATVARLAGLTHHYFGTDPNGYSLVASPLQSLFVAAFYHLPGLLWVGALFLAAWNFLKPLRSIISIGAVVMFAGMILLDQIDFGMMRYLGQRFTPAIMETYMSPDLVSSQLYNPFLHDWGYFSVSLGIVLLSWLALGAGCGFYLKSQSKHHPSPSASLVFFLGASVLFLPQLSFDPLKDKMLKPVELLYVSSFFKSDLTPAPADAQAAMENLRNGIDLAVGEEWVSPEYPIVRTGPEHKPGDDGEPRELPDIILFVVESLRGRDVGYGMFPPNPSNTPRLDRLAQKAVVFPHHIANGDPSTRGFLSLNTSLWPHRAKYVIAHFIDLKVSALPRRLKDLGYRTMILWGSNPSFDNQLQWARKWYDRLDFELPENRLIVTRRMSDRMIMDHLIQGIQEHDSSNPGQPLFAYVATSGTHYPFTLEDSYFVPLTAFGDANRVDTRGIDDVQTRYNITLKNLDYHIGRVLDFLESRNKKDNTVIIVLGDHSYNTYEWVDPGIKDMPVDYRVWTSAMIYGPERLVGPTPRWELFPSSHVDLMPTLLDMVGDHRPFASMGTNLLRPVPGGQKSAVAIRHAGFRVDKGDFSLYVQTGNPGAFWVSRSFQLKPDFRTSLQGTPFSPEEVKQWSQRINYWSHLIEQNRVWDDRFLKDSPNTVDPFRHDFSPGKN
ncbi:MAG: LTA synthase family protein [Nitrospinaceae bacterium]